MYSGWIMSRMLFYHLVGTIILAVIMTGCSGLGKAPSEHQKERYVSSSNFDARNGVFKNRPEPEVDVIRLRRQRESGEIRSDIDGDPPDRRLPDIKPDFADFASNDSDLKAIWFGHSSFLVKLESAFILIDPVFGRSSPVPFVGGPRFQDAPISRRELPKIDFIVISHDHYDHLERGTVRFFAKTDTVFIVPLGVSSHLLYWGVKEENIIELDWWDSVTRSGIKFTATPARHSSGRTDRRDNYTLWSSWVMKTKRHSLFYSGDSGYGSHFREIGEKHGPFDIVFLESGQYNPNWGSHLLPDHWPVVIRELRGEKWFPAHWGMFSFAPHAWDAPIIAAVALAREHHIPILTPKIGEIVDLVNPQRFDQWWTE